MSNVVIHRNLLFVPNEAYIAAQARALRRYKPVLSGLRIDGRASIPEDVDHVVLTDLVSRPTARLQETLLRLFRVAPPALLRKLRDVDPVLFHVHFGGDAYWALPIWRRLRVPLVVTFHGYDVNLHATSSVPAFVYSRLRPVVWNTAARVIAVSDFLKQRLMSLGCPPSKIVRHYVGIDTDFFSRSGEPDERPTIAFVGRLLDFKGCDLLIEAVSRLRRNNEVKIIVAGSGPEEPRLRAQAASRRVDIDFRSSQPPSGVRKALEQSWIFCLPTYRSRRGDEESFSIVCAEAHSMGLPVVASRLGGVPEAVSDGQTGILVEPRDVEELAEALRVLLEDSALRRRMSATARRRAVEQFDIRRQTALLEEIYDSVVYNPSIP